MVVKQNPNIKGIRIDDKTYKIGQYAHDTYLSSLGSSVDLYSNFSTCSGLKVNVKKSHVVWLGIDKMIAVEYHIYTPRHEIMCWNG